MNYEGWHETLMEPEFAYGNDSLRVLEDRRVFRLLTPDVHHQAGMRCVDCHISWELMGDGNLHSHKEEQTMVRCEDCHFSGRPRMMGGDRADADAVRLLVLAGKDPDTVRMLATGIGNRAIYNTRYSDSSAMLLRKADGKRLRMASPGRDCSRGTVHERLDCAACHTAWAPTCLGCHNTYDPGITGFDHLDRRFVKGSWVEHVGAFLAGLPTLGMMEDDDGGRIVTAVPGMVLSIDPGGYNKDAKPLFRRLFAPVAAHTIVRQGPGCMDCHNDPLMMGFGRGSLEYRVSAQEGVWVFTPRFASRGEDGLPEDAWTGFLAPPFGEATRKGLRPLSIQEQKTMLRVGACLHCHTEDSDVMRASIRDFQALLDRRSERCILPRE